MRIAAVVLNGLVLVSLGLTFADTMPSSEYYPLVVLLIGTPIFTIVVLLLPSSGLRRGLRPPHKAAEEKSLAAQAQSHQDSQAVPDHDR